MNRDELQDLLQQVRDGQLSIDDGLARMKNFPIDDIGFAKLDTHRNLRRGFPEVVFCLGKTTSQSVEIINRMADNDRLVLATRANKDIYDAIREKHESAVHNEIARTITVGNLPNKKTEQFIAIVSAGTSDMPVAEEAAITAEAMGNPVQRIYDVGVAGIHRLLKSSGKILEAHVVVVVAGMEGALASVVGGMVDSPVVAVPTSVGYGASFGGIAALLAMLNSCAPGVTVVNIDNGFGAGYSAAIINLGKPTK